MALTNLSQITTSGISTLADVNLNNLTGVAATFTGNVTIGGTLTYDDVTNIDSVGIITARSGIRVLTGTATTALVVEGNSRITGILTVGTSSLTLNGSTNVVKVGTALTLGHTQGLQFHTQNLHSQGFEINNVNATGIITATTFIGNLTGNVTGNITGGATVDFSIADKIVHTGNTNTAIRFPAADTVTVETGGAETARFTSSAITFKAPDGGSRYFFGEMGNSANAELSLYNSSDAQKVRISAGQATFFTGGNVGIGTNNPTDTGGYGQALDITGGSNGAAIYLRSANGDTGQIALGSSDLTIRTRQADPIIFNTNNSERLRLDSNGYLGLNNSAPHNQYYNNFVIGDGSAAGDKGITIRTTSSNEGVIAFSDSDSGAARYAGKIAYNHGSNAMMFFTLNGDERLRITSDGSVGTGGLIASSGNLVVNSTIRSQNSSSNISYIGFTQYTGDTSVGSMFSYMGGDARNTGYLNFSTNNTERLRIAADGKIAIGGNYGDTSAFGRKVLIAGTLGLNNDSGNVGLGFHRGTGNNYGYIGTGAWAINGLDNDDFGISSGSTGDLVFGTGAGTEKVRISNAGNVGINDPAPSEKLNVGGNIMLEGGNQFMYLTNVGTGNAGIYVRGNTSGSFLRSHSTGMFTWEVTGSEKMRLTSDGNLGLGCVPETDLQVRNGTGGTVKIGGSGSGATGFQIQYNNSGTTSTEFLTNYRSTNSAASLKIDTGTFIVATGTSGAEKLRITPTGQVTVSNTVSSNDAAVNILKSSGDNSDKAILRVGYDAAACFETYRIRNDANIYMGATQAGADILISTKPSGTSSSAVAVSVTDGGVTNPRRFATGAMHNSGAYKPHQLGYMGDYFPYGCNAVYYLAQTSTGNSGYSSHMFSWYDSGHWGQYGKFVLFCHEAAYIGGFCQRFLSGTNVNTMANGGQLGTVSTTQTQTGSGTHAGQNVYRYDCTVGHSGTYRTMRWYLGLLAGCSLGVAGSGKTQAEAQTYANSNGSMLHLFGVADSNLTMAPNYRTW